MAHGPDQAILGLGRPTTSAGLLDEAEDNDLDSLVGVLGADSIDITDSAGWTSATEVESALAEAFSRLPLSDVLTVSFDADSGSTGDTPTATGLSIPVKASKTYLVEIWLTVTATTNGGVEVSFTAPGSSTFDYSALIFQADNVVAQRVNGAVANPINYIAAALSNDPILIKGVLTTDSAGSFVVLGAQDTSHADNTLIEAGSSMTLIPVV